MRYCTSCGEEISESRVYCEDCGPGPRGEEAMRPVEEPNDDGSHDHAEKMWEGFRNLLPEGARAMVPEQMPGEPAKHPRYVCEKIEGGHLVKRPAEGEDGEIEWEQVFRLPEGEGELGRRIVAMLNSLADYPTYDVELGLARFALTLIRVLSLSDFTESGKNKLEIIKTGVLLEERMNLDPEIEKRALEEKKAADKHAVERPTPEGGEDRE